MNDVIAINGGKISKVLPEFRKVANDRPYSLAEISRLLEKVDHRGRIIILLMASSGMREGAIHSIKLSDIATLQDIYKITVYKNDPAEYYTFCSPECTKTID
jgi:integrase